MKERQKTGRWETVGRMTGDQETRDCRETGR